jgi:hypothetical protein
MKTYLFLLIFTALSILAASCTKELKYTKEQLFEIARAGDPTLELILPKTMKDGVSCSNYTSGCVSGHTVKIKGIHMIAVEFMHEEEAIVAAKKIRGYYVRNWVLDDVTGEPILEKFVVQYLEAKKP